MPTYRVMFIKEMEVDVEAGSKAEARMCAEETIREGIDDDMWNAPDWTVSYVQETSDPNADILQGIGESNTMVHPMDAVPPEERDQIICRHGVEVDIEGVGCEICQRMMSL